MPDDVMVAGGDGSPFAAAREELNALQNTTARFSDSKNELAKSAARIAELEETIRDRDAELLRKDQLLREKEELLRRHEELLRDRDRRLAKLASGMAARMLEEGVYVVGFSYPVVPKGAARIRVHTVNSS